MKGPEELCERLVQLSFAKIINSRNEKGGAKLRKNLLILHLLQRARLEQRSRSEYSPPFASIDSYPDSSGDCSSDSDSDSFMDSSMMPMTASDGIDWSSDVPDSSGDTPVDMSLKSMSIKHDTDEESGAAGSSNTASICNLSSGSRILTPSTIATNSSLTTSMTSEAATAAPADSDAGGGRNCDENVIRGAQVPTDSVTSKRKRRDEDEIQSKRVCERSINLISVLTAAAAPQVPCPPCPAMPLPVLTCES